MALTALKQLYWRMLAARHRRRTCQVLTPHDWMSAIERFVPRDRDRLVMVDGGAHEGRVARQFADRLPGLEVHAFEPNVDLLPMLEVNLAGVPGTRNTLALGARTETRLFTVNAFSTTSSLLERSENSRRYFNEATEPHERREVQVVSLDDWAARTGIDRVDILKLDLQGYEGEALRGAARLLDRGVACVFAEVHFAPFYEGSALFSDIDLLLRRHGYRLHNLYNLCTHNPAGHLGSGDALFVRDEAAARQEAIRPSRAA